MQETPVNVTAISNAIDQLESSAKRLNGFLKSKDLNHKLYFAERLFLSQEGLPGRVWFQHILEAP